MGCVPWQFLRTCGRRTAREDLAGRGKARDACNGDSQQGGTTVVLDGVVYADALEDAFEIEIDSLGGSLASELLCHVGDGGSRTVMYFEEYRELLRNFPFGSVTSTIYSRIVGVGEDEESLTLEKVRLLLSECVELCREGFISKAYNLLAAIESQMPDILASDGFWRAQIDLIRSLYDRYKVCWRSATTDYENYTLTRSEGPRLMYRHLKGTTVHSLKWEAEYKFSTDQLLAFGREFNYFDTWNPYAIDPMFIKERGDFCMTVYCAVWFPWPFSPRELVVTAEVADMLDEHGCWFVSLYDAKIDETVADFLKEVRQGKPKRERVAILEGSCAMLYPTEEGNTKVFMGVHGDPLVFVPPNWLINFVLKLMAPTVHRSLLDALQKVYVKETDGPYPKMLRSREIYAKMRSRQKAMK
mmetsp:Transcript_7473/g.19191  ORF Transcript_7473/g.19191 Transcript_7473/m.19191 type:complete len:414 (-) Transcript_7473:47-1288(-)